MQLTLTEACEVQRCLVNTPSIWIMDCKSSESLYVHVYLIALHANLGRECGKRTRVYLAMPMEIFQLSHWVVSLMSMIRRAPWRLF